MRPMQALFFAGPMLLAKGTNAAGYVVDLDGQTDFHMDDKYSCRVGQSGHGDQCSPGYTIASGRYAPERSGFVDDGRTDPYGLKNWVLTW